MKKNPYQVSNTFFLRTPILSLDFYNDLTSEEEISNERIVEICKSDIIQEALFLASPSLFKTLKKWFNGDLTDKKKIKALKLSLFKYLTRMSSRCIPFGTFAGMTTGNFIIRESELVIDKVENHQKHTRLDMNYLVALSQKISDIPIIKNQLYFFPNTSMYTIGNEIRYVEYFYQKGERKHNVMSVSNSKYLQSILKKAYNGRKINDLIWDLMEDDINEETARNFVFELIDNQFLVSEIEPSVSGDDFLSQINQIVSKLPGAEQIKFVLDEIETNIKELDRHIGLKEKQYSELVRLIKKIDIDFDIKYQFQVDLKINTLKSSLNANYKKMALKAFSVLRKITRKRTNGNLSDFARSFKERYGDKKMDLAYVLDPEIGIGFLQNQLLGEGDINPLLDDLIIIQEPKVEDSTLKWSILNTIVLKKVEEAKQKKQHSISLTDNDLEYLDAQLDWDDIGCSTSTIAEIYRLDGKQMIMINGIGHTSASNLVNRLGHIDKKILIEIEEISEIEKEYYNGKIVAEIIHLPEDRVGNILIRPTTRDFEIPYMAKSNLDKKKQININDIQVSVNLKNRVILTSKKLGKEIIPYLSTAHFYNHHDSLPVYQFLCNIQSQYSQSLTFNFLPIETQFIPRIEFENVILQKAIWNINRKEIEELNEIIVNKNEKTKIIEKCNEFRIKRNLPQYVSLVEGDNELLINFKNITSLQMFQGIIKNNFTIQLKEFLFNEDTNMVLDCDNNKFSNQILLTFYKER